MDEFSSSKRDSEDYFCRFTFGQFVGLILFEVITLFFVFYLGAKFGGDLMGHGAQVAKGSDNVLPSDSPKNVDEIIGKKAVDYTYPDVLTGPKQDGAIKVKPSGLTAEEFEKRGRETAAETKEPQTPQIPDEEPAKPSKKEVEPRKTAMAEVKKTVPEDRVEEAEEVKEKPAPAETPKKADVKPRGKYSIQVGSYQSEEEARTVLNRWKGKGYASYLAVGEVPNKGTWYRVRIGGFSSRDEANVFLGRFKSKENTNALVVLSKN